MFTAPANRKQVKMTADVVERIFKEFKFRTLSKTSSKNAIYKSIMNTAFKTNIINSSYGDDMNVSYSINAEFEPYLEPLQRLCKDFSRVAANETLMHACIDAWIDEPLECFE